MKKIGLVIGLVAVVMLGTGCGLKDNLEENNKKYDVAQQSYDMNFSEATDKVIEQYSPETPVEKVAFDLPENDESSQISYIYHLVGEPTFVINAKNSEIIEKTEKSSQANFTLADIKTLKDPQEEAKKIMAEQKSPFARILNWTLVKKNEKLMFDYEVKTFSGSKHIEIDAKE